MDIKNPFKKSDSSKVPEPVTTINPPASSDPFSNPSAQTPLSEGSPQTTTPPPNQTTPSQTAPTPNPQQPSGVASSAIPETTGGFASSKGVSSISTPEPLNATPNAQQTTPGTAEGGDTSQTTQIPSLGTMPTSFETPSAESTSSTDLASSEESQKASDAIVTEVKSGPSKFRILVILLIVVAVIVYAVVGYLYFTNSQLEDEATQPSTQPAIVAPIEATPEPEVTETLPSTEIKLDNGNIIRETASGDSSILVDKDDYETTGIAGFSEVSVSPDEENMCFASAPPALEPALYYSGVDAITVTKISEKVKNCTWNNSSDNIAYISNTAQSIPTDLFIYSLTTSEETNLTKVSSVSGVFRKYEIVSWSADDSLINCTYEEIDLSDTTNEVLGRCKIDVATSEVTDL